MSRKTVFILGMIFIMGFLTSCQEKQPKVVSQNNSENCVFTPYVEICASFSFVDDRGTFVGLEYKALGAGIESLSDELPPEISGDYVFSLFDGQGKPYRQEEKTPFLPLGAEQYINDDTHVLIFAPTPSEGSYTLTIPYVAYRIPVDATIDIVIPAGTVPGDSFYVDLPVKILDQVVLYEKADVFFTDLGGVILAEGNEIEGSPEENGFPENNDLYLQIESAPIDKDAKRKIIGLFLSGGQGMGFDPFTRKHLLSYRFPEGKNTSFRDEYHISLSITSAWVVDEGPFDLNFQIPSGDKALVDLMAQDENEILDAPVDKAELSGFIYYSVYAPGYKKMFRQEAQCLLENPPCAESELFYADLPYTYSLSCSSNPKWCILSDIDNDSHTFHLFSVETNTWQSIDNILSSDQPGFWSPNNLWYVQNAGMTENNQLILFNPSKKESYFFAEDIRGYKDVLGWQDADTIIFRNFICNSDGSTDGAIYSFDIKSQTRKKITDWAKTDIVSLSPDGHFFAFYDYENGGLSFMDVTEKDIKTVPVLNSSALYWSPNSQWVATVNIFDGCSIDVVRFNGAETNNIFKGEYCYDLNWGPESSYILFIGARNGTEGDKLFLVSLQDKEVFEIELPKKDESTGRIEIFWEQ